MSSQQHPPPPPPHQQHQHQQHQQHPRQHMTRRQQDQQQQRDFEYFWNHFLGPLAARMKDPRYHQHYRCIADFLEQEPGSGYLKDLVENHNEECADKYYVYDGSATDFGTNMFDNFEDRTHLREFLCAMMVLHHDPTYLSDEYRRHPYSIFYGIEKFTSVFVDDIEYDLNEVRETIRHVSNGWYTLARDDERMKQFWKVFKPIPGPSALAPLPKLQQPTNSPLTNMDKYDFAGSGSSTVAPPTLVERLKKELEETKARKEQAENRLQIVEKELTKTKTELETTVTDLTKTRTRLTTSENQLEKTEQRLEKTEQRLNEKWKELDEAIDKIDLLRSKDPSVLSTTIAAGRQGDVTTSQPQHPLPAIQNAPIAAAAATAATAPQAAKAASASRIVDDDGRSVDGNDDNFPNLHQVAASYRRQLRSGVVPDMTVESMPDVIYVRPSITSQSSETNHYLPERMIRLGSDGNKASILLQMGGGGSDGYWKHVAVVNSMHYLIAAEHTDSQNTFSDSFRDWESLFNNLPSGTKAELDDLVRLFKENIPDDGASHLYPPFMVSTKRMPGGILVNAMEHYARKYLTDTRVQGRFAVAFSKRDGKGYNVVRSWWGPSTGTPEGKAFRTLFNRTHFKNVDDQEVGLAEMLYGVRKKWISPQLQRYIDNPK